MSPSVHRAALAALPSKRSVDVLAPATSGARHVLIDTAHERFVFVSRGHLSAEPVAGGAETVLATGTVNGVWSHPSIVAGKVVAMRVDTRAAPAIPRTVEIVDAKLSVSAHTYGASVNGLVIGVDVVRGDVHAIDVATGTVTHVTKLETQQDPQLPGLVHVEESGERALVMLSSSSHGQAWLVEIDLVNKRAKAVHPPIVKGAVSGTYWRGNLVVAEHALGDDPRLRILVGGKPIFERAGAHPHGIPLPLSDAHLLVVMSPQLDPITGMGDAQLCVLDMNGNFAALAPVDGTALRLVRSTDGNTVVVEGGRSVTRVRLN